LTRLLPLMLLCPLTNLRPLRLSRPLRQLPTLWRSPYSYLWRLRCSHLWRLLYLLRLISLRLLSRLH
jgi:hypothetical protein